MSETAERIPGAPDVGPLRKLDLSPVPVNPAFAIDVKVAAASHAMGILLTVCETRADLACELCGQSVLCLQVEGHSYRLTAAHISGQVLSHLIQAHGWTREDIGER